MMPRLGQKYAIEIETISKPIADYQTDEYFELDLPTAPAVMVAEEIVVEGSDVAEAQTGGRDLPPPGSAPAGAGKKRVLEALIRQITSVWRGEGGWIGSSCAPQEDWQAFALKIISATIYHFKKFAVMARLRPLLPDRAGKYLPGRHQAAGRRRTAITCRPTDQERFLKLGWRIIFLVKVICLPGNRRTYGRSLIFNRICLQNRHFLCALTYDSP